MSSANLEQRVAALEQQVSQLLRLRNGQAVPPPERDDWKKSIGMFRGDSVFQEMLDDVARQREAERETARQDLPDYEP